MQTPSFNFFCFSGVCVCVSGGGWRSFLSVFPSPFPLSFVAILDGDKHTYSAFVSCLFPGADNAKTFNFFLNT